MNLILSDECNVLIATGMDCVGLVCPSNSFFLDIVQEGLDIPTCSYVIRYEFVSDEIGTIQSRGRARASNSSYYLITELDSTNHQREMNNRFRETEMDEAIEKWTNMDKEAFQRDVENKTVSEQQNRMSSHSVGFFLRRHSFVTGNRT